MYRITDIKPAADLDLKKIEVHEWHLWYLAFTLLFLLGGATAATYFFLLSDSYQEAGFLQSTLYKALGGFYFLIFLFCVYIVQTRATFAKLRAVIQQQATRDALTNLYNRRYFDQRIGEEIDRANRERYPVGFLLCDIDQFRIINDTLGRQVGDDVLKGVARVIQESTRGTDLIFRWGGDEIMVVLADTTHEGILIAAERIRKGIHRIAREHHLEMDLSVGVAVYPEHEKNLDDLISLAGRALYIAKKSGDKIHIGDQEYHLDEQVVKMVFQPVVDVWAAQIVGYEALGRDPEGKLSILNLFKKYQAIGQLTVLKCICFKSALRIAQEVGLKRVFINVDFSMLLQLGTIVKPEGLEVILEISEAEVLKDVENHLGVVTKWREQNYKFAIDDFGAGFISLPFIARLVPEYIKLDRATVLHAVASNQFRGFLKKLIPALRMYATEGIIAEGIETEDELSITKDLGIFIVQGFLLGKPTPLK